MEGGDGMAQDVSGGPSLRAREFRAKSARGVGGSADACAQSLLQVEAGPSCCSNKRRIARRIARTPAGERGQNMLGMPLSSKVCGGKPEQAITTRMDATSRNSSASHCDAPILIDIDESSDPPKQRRSGTDFTTELRTDMRRAAGSISHTSESSRPCNSSSVPSSSSLVRSPPSGSLPFNPSQPSQADTATTPTQTSSTQIASGCTAASVAAGSTANTDDQPDFDDIAAKFADTDLSPAEIATNVASVIVATRKAVARNRARLEASGAANPARSAEDNEISRLPVESSLEQHLRQQTSSALVNAGTPKQRQLECEATADIQTDANTE
eukprot:5340088-Pleurochrysis_carterae.AAC.1